MQILLFEISAPFGHFRNPYATAFKQTYPFPPKPTVAGILGSMLGWSEKEVVSKTPSLKVGVMKALNEGKFVEYGYVFGVQGNKVEIRPERFEFLIKPKIQILVAAEDQTLIDEIAQRIASRDFVFPLYMGKNEFPITDIKILQQPLTERIRQLRVAKGVIPTFSVPEFKMRGGIRKPPFVYIGVPLEFALYSGSRKRWRKLAKTYIALFSDQEVELVEPLPGFETKLGPVIVI